MPPRLFRAAVAALGLLLSLPQVSLAQESAQPPRTWELRVTSGGYIPTGGQRQAVDDAHLTAVQLSWVAIPSLAVTGTVAWARSRDLAIDGTPKLDIFSSDLGLEYRPIQPSAGITTTFRPFAGLGVGARSYDHRKLDGSATHNLAGYAAVGGELAVRRAILRLEVRDYVAGFRPLDGIGQSRTRNDVVVMAALSVRKRPSPEEQVTK